MLPSRSRRRGRYCCGCAVRPSAAVRCTVFTAPTNSPATGGMSFAVKWPTPMVTAVVAVGSEVEGFAVGDRVGVHIVTGCGQCRHCKSGNEIFCDTLRYYGNGHAEYAVAPAHQCLKLPDDIPWDVAVLIAGDAMGVAYHSSRRMRVCANETCAVFGCGPIGLGVIVLWDFLGVRMIGVDISEKRLELAREMGAFATVNAGEDGYLDRLRELTGGAGPDMCLECTGKPGPVYDALAAVAKGGRVAICGEQPEASFNPSRDLIHKEVDIRGCWYWRMNELPAMTELVRRGLDVTRVVSHRLPLERAQEGYDLMASGDGGKILLQQYE